ncbi:hypothetical protein A2U01_0091984, partial [Trifolium medium]|nr:hypothetical protein [Trifolium medium]
FNSVDGKAAAQALAEFDADDAGVDPPVVGTSDHVQ